MADTPQFGGDEFQGEDPEERPSVPFLSGLDLSELMRLFQSDGPINWEVARQVATWVALEGRPEPTVDEADRTQFEELVRAAQTIVAGSTALPATVPTSPQPMGPSAWADLHLEALRPVAEALAGSLNDAIRDDLAALDTDQVAGLFGSETLGNLPFGEDQLGAMLPGLAPTLLGLQTGSMVGYLAQRSLGRYDLPLPTGDQPSLVFVVANVDELESEWSLPREDLRFYLALHEVVHAAQRTVPWVQDKLVALASEFVSGYAVDARAFEERFGPVDPTDPAEVRAVFGQPDALLGTMRSPEQAGVLARLQAVTSVLEGYADMTLERIGRPLVPTFDRIHEAIVRHRLEQGEAGRFIEGLLGLRLDREHYERGAAFCAGVVERGGPEALDRLWEHEDRFPTPAELEAPGLWLARIDLPTADS